MMKKGILFLLALLLSTTMLVTVPRASAEEVEIPETTQETQPPEEESKLPKVMGGNADSQD